MTETKEYRPNEKEFSVTAETMEGSVEQLSKKFQSLSESGKDLQTVATELAQEVLAPFPNVNLDINDYITRSLEKGGGRELKSEELKTNEFFTDLAQIANPNLDHLYYADNPLIEAGEGKIPQNGQSSDESESRRRDTILKSQFLRSVLKEVDLDPNDYEVHIGKNRDDMVRKQPFQFFVIQELDKTVVVSDDYGEASFVIYDTPDNIEGLLKKPKLKDELTDSDEFDVIRVEYPNQGDEQEKKNSWQDRMQELITNDYEDGLAVPEGRLNKDLQKDKRDASYNYSFYTITFVASFLGSSSSTIRKKIRKTLSEDYQIEQRYLEEENSTRQVISYETFLKLEELYVPESKFNVFKKGKNLPLPDKNEGDYYYRQSDLLRKLAEYFGYTGENSEGTMSNTLDSVDEYKEDKQRVPPDSTRAINMIRLESAYQIYEELDQKILTNLDNPEQDGGYYSLRYI